MIDPILSAREDRLKEIESCVSSQNLVLLIKPNIPGPDKNTTEAHLLVRLFHHLIQTSFSVLTSTPFESADGPYQLISLVPSDANEFKKKMIHLEDTHPLGRFIDLDVFDSYPVSLSRKSLGYTPRQCYLCELPAAQCVRNQTHPLTDLLAFVKISVFDFLKKEMEDAIKDAMMKELNLEHKFGLVTPTSHGSHPDMDYDLMIKAQDAIMPYFSSLFSLGYTSDNLSDLFFLARPLGIKAEKLMLNATQGINAYKGLIFILGLIILSSGYTLRQNQPFSMIFQNIKEMTREIFNDFEESPDTAGKNAYLFHGLSGIRGEVKNGCPSVQSALLLTITSGHPLHELLIHLILVSEDTVFLKRAKSYPFYLKVKTDIEKINPNDSTDLIRFTKYAIDHDLSFGGSADLLVSTLFLKSIRHFFK